MGNAGYIPWGAATTLNPADKASNVTLSGGDLIATNSGIGMVRSTTSHASGKWRYQFTVGATQIHEICGVATSAASVAVSWLCGSDIYGWGINNYVPGPAIYYYHNGGAASIDTVSLGNNAVVDIYIDLDVGTMKWAKNGVAKGDVVTGTSFGTVFAGISNYSGGVVTCNFGATAFAYPAVYF